MLKIVREADPKWVAPKMFYKYPGPFKLFKDKFDFAMVNMVDEDSVKAHLDAGWYRTPDEARDAYDPEVAKAKAGEDIKVAEKAKAETDKVLKEAKEAVEAAEELATEALEKAEEALAARVVAEKDASDARLETEAAIKAKDVAEKELAAKVKSPEQIMAEAKSKTGGRGGK